MFHIPSLPSVVDFIQPPPEPILFVRCWMRVMGSGTEYELDSNWTKSESDIFTPSEYKTREELDALTEKEASKRSKKQKSKKQSNQLNAQPNNNRTHAQSQANSVDLIQKVRTSYYSKNRVATQADIEAEKAKMLAINNEDDFAAMLSSVVKGQTMSEKDRRQKSIRNEFQEIGNQSRQ